VPAAKRWLALASTFVPVDHPGLVTGSLEKVLLQVSGGQLSSMYAHFIAIEDGLDVACETARLPMRDNLSNVVVSVSVLPPRRRRGIGATLAE